MTTELALVPMEQLERRIFLIRGQKVMLDADLAMVYGVPTKALNQAVKRNLSRFPGDFMFQLTVEEKREVVTNCDHLKRLKFSRALPYAFTEHGAVMLASVLNSPVAVQASVYVVRAFLKLREFLAAHKELSARLATLEARVEGHDGTIHGIVVAIRELAGPLTARRGKRIGFRVEMPVKRGGSNPRVRGPE